MPINHDMMHSQSHSMFEKAGEVLEGVVKLKERIAKLEQNLSEIQSQKMQLEDDVALLRRNNAELKEAQRWRKFSEEKPKEKQWVLVFVENPSKYGTYLELRRWDAGLKFDVEEQELYTKWMPLPKAPEVK